MPLREFVLSAGTLSNEQCYGTEPFSGGEYRWSRATPLTWAVNFHGRDGMTLVIPYALEIEKGFFERSKLFLDGEETAFTREPYHEFGALMANTAKTNVREVRLETPQPISSPSNPADTRTLGVGLLVRRSPPMQPVDLSKLALATGASPKIALIGNCQVQTYEWLIKQMIGVDPLTVADFSHSEYRTPKYKQSFLEGAKQADFVLAMHSQYVPAQEIRESTAAPVYTIGNMYFRGLFPDICYVGSIDLRLGKPTGYHSVVVLDAFQRGLSPEECDNQFTQENFARLGLFGAWDSSAAELESLDPNLDFPASALILDSCRRYQAMLTINHPGVLLCYTYLASIFETIGVSYKPLTFERFHEPLLTHDTCMVHDAWADHLQLPYRSTQQVKVNDLGRRYVSRLELIRHFYEAYRSVPTDALVVNSPRDMVEDLQHNPELRHLARTWG